MINEEWKEIVDIEILQSIQYYSRHKHKIASRLAELDEEWDIAKTAQLNAIVITALGAALAATLNKRWLILPAIGMLLLKGEKNSGGSAATALLRALGFRTNEEIEREKFGLKALRGEFKKPVAQRSHSGMVAV